MAKTTTRQANDYNLAPASAWIDNPCTSPLPTDINGWTFCNPRIASAIVSKRESNMKGKQHSSLVGAVTRASSSPIVDSWTNPRRRGGGAFLAALIDIARTPLLHPINTGFKTNYDSFVNSKPVLPHLASWKFCFTNQTHKPWCLIGSQIDRVAVSLDYLRCCIHICADQWAM